MKHISVRFLILLTILCGMVAPLCSGCGALGLEESEPSHTENYSVSDGTQVTLSNGSLNGDIRVETWGKDYVELTWTKSTTMDRSELANADVEVTEAPGRLDIETKLLNSNARVSVDYDIKLPRDVLLTRVTAGNSSVGITGTSGDAVIATKSGSINVKNTSGYLDIAAERAGIRLEGTTGGARLSTSQSSIAVVNADGDIKATNANGSISIEGCKGNMTLATSSAGISVSDLLGCVLSAKTSNAPITIRKATAVELAETSKSDVVTEFSSVSANGTRIAVDSGSVSLYLANDINANIELRTESGEIVTHSFWGITLSDNAPEGCLDGTVGAGGNTIHVETTKGNIDLYRSETPQQ